MPIANMLSITPNTFLSMVIWIVLLLAALYFARKPFHRVVRSLTRIIHNAMRLTAASVLSAEKSLVRRNREVLMAAGLEKAERMVEREFDRINAAVVRDMDSYPNLQRKLLELTTRLDEDYRRSADVIPDLPNWIPIIESIANIKHSSDSMVAKVLGEINRTLNEQHKAAIENFRNSNAARHAILNKMLPAWRKVQKTLNDFGQAISNLIHRAKRLDRYMDEYEQIRRQTDSAARKLSSSSLTRFFISSLVLMIVSAGVLINFELVALPLSLLVGDASFIGPYKTANFAGLVVILIQLTMGVFLMDALHLTRIFPVIGSMDDRLRVRLIWIALLLLIAMAGVESSLVYTRDRMALQGGFLRSTLAGTESVGTAASTIPMAAQLTLGFIMPFVLAFTAIPLEAFILSSRTVLGIVAAGTMRLSAFFLRLVGNLAYYCGRLVINFYDLAIFPAIWLEDVISDSKSGIPTPAEQRPLDGGSKTEDTVDNFIEKIEYKDSQGPRKPPPLS